MLWVIEYISVSAVMGAGGFALTATHFFFKRQKKVSKKRLAPSVRPLAKARRSFVPVFIWGHRLRSASLRPPLDVCGFAARRYAPTPQMNTSTQPPEGAGRARSRAGELTLGLMSGKKRVAYTQPCRSEACPRRRPASRPISLRCTRSNCGSWLACEGGLTANQSPSDALGPIVGAGLPAKAA